MTSLAAAIGAILFVGHSLFGFVIPAMLEEALRRAGTPARVEAQITNGAPLSWNWEHSAEAQGVDARAALPTGDYGTVILTEAQPLHAQIRWNDTAGNARRFYDLAVGANPAAQVFLHETWPSLNSGTATPIEGDDRGAIPWRERLDLEHPEWQGIVAAVNAARAEGRPPMRLIPAGRAMALAHDAIARGEVPGVGTIADLFIDDIHTNDLGNYLVTMVIYAAVTGADPAGLPAKLVRTWSTRQRIVTPALARAFQGIAWQAVAAEAAAAAAAATGGDGTLPAAATPASDSAAGPPATAPPAASAAALPAPAAPPAAALRPSAAVAALPAIANPALGMNLAGLKDWSVELPFLDLMKLSRPWVGHLPGRWGGMQNPELAAGGWLDAEGWPRALPPAVTGLASVILTDLPAAAGGVAGRYRLTHAGRGRLVVAGRARVVSSGAGTILFDYDPGPGPVEIRIEATDPADPIRDIRVVRLDRAPALDAGTLFNPDFLARLRGVRLLRFMDWMDTNSDPPGERMPRPADATWAGPGGAPVEVMVALANELGADPWFTLPHRATDAYVRRFAEVVRERLAPGLRAHVELSNEVWNWSFPQAHWAEAAARDRWGEPYKWMQFYAVRAVEMAAIWEDVLGPAAATRLVRVISTQPGWPGLEEEVLAAPLWTAEADGRAPPAAHFDLYAITGYVGGGLGSDAKVQAVRGWLADSLAAAAAAADALGLEGEARAAHVARHRFDRAVTTAAAELRDGSVTGAREDTLANLLGAVFPYHAEVARRHGLRLGLYEGGTHIVGEGAQIGDEELTAFFVHLSYTPEVGALVADLLAGWAAVSDEPFTAYLDVLAPSRWGSWGGLRHLEDDNPRWRALAGLGP